MKKILAIAAFAVLAPMSQAAELITNGGFEDSTFSGAFTTYGTGGGLNGWTIESGSVDLINTYWQPASGHYSLDLNGNSAGVISQSFATVVGQTYNVSFSMAGNTDGGGAVKVITVGAGGDHSISFDSTGKSHGDMGWTTQSFSFVADSVSSTLRFSGSANNTYYGAALDNISVTAAPVPEPETYAMLVAGLGLLGFVARRKQK
jgi:choice-of-anchor C domain-containing protein